MGCTQSASGRTKQSGYKCTHGICTVGNINPMKMMPGDKKNGNNGNNHNKKDACMNEDDIQPFVPTPSLLQWYDAQLEEGRRRYNAPSPMVKNDSFADLKNNYGGGGDGGSSGIRSLVGSGLEKKRRNNSTSIHFPSKQAVLTLYCFTPLERLIGKGVYSRVTLADMTVRLTTAHAFTVGGVSTRTLATAGDHTGNGVLEKEGHREAVTSGGVHAVPSSKYLIACKEYELVDKNAKNLYERLVEEVERLSGLSFSSRLLKVLQMEGVYDKPKVAGGGEEEVVMVSGQMGGNAGKSAGEKRYHQFLKIHGNSSSHAAVRTPNRVRIYMEYAKYGTLRDILLTEMPEKFGKAYMHELTIRAYMREVLVALAFLHENNVLHTDLCAKNVYLMNHITSVYMTSFPAYIADLPAGRFLKVPAEWVRRVLALMDPASMQPQFDLEQATVQLNDSIVSHVGWNPLEEAQAAGKRMTISDADGAAAQLNTNVECRAGATTDANTDIHMHSSNINKNNNNAEIDADEGKCRWVDDEVRLYLHENEYSDQDSLPLPSPNSGVDLPKVLTCLDSDGLTVVRGGSFSPSTRMPALPPLLSTVALCDNGTGTMNDINSRSEADHSIDSMKRRGLDFGLPNVSRLDRTEGGAPMHTMARSGCRKRKPLIKLGHYGLVRSIIVGERGGQAHRLGSVTHLAPESTEHSSFSPESDIYAFAMTFIELATPRGDVFGGLRPKNIQEAEDKDAYDAHWLANIRRFLAQNNNKVPLPPQLSDECKAMLQRCLEHDVTKRPTAVELLQAKYFLLGYWAAMATKNGAMEAPWLDTNYEAAAQASGLPRLPSNPVLYAAGV